jgi:vacuolar protein sorting-associated protein 18
MALDSSSGSAARIADPAESPIFGIQRVQLQFSVAADFVAAQVTNDVLIVALSTGRILRIDLGTPEDIDGILFACLSSLSGWQHFHLGALAECNLF